uniref:Uncharacterized protein n=1 Tax=Desertifilum tharense IPPAS B-1220 TaxID=1781255 RepID=A0ACD5GWN9_9CYAN
MYWTDDTTNRIQRANLDGTGVENLIVSGLDRPRAIALDLFNDKIYWVDSGRDIIERANLDGTGREVVLDLGESFPSVIPHWHCLRCPPQSDVLDGWNPKYHSSSQSRWHGVSRLLSEAG